MFPGELKEILAQLHAISGLDVREDSMAYLTGSHAQGLATPESDFDYLMVYAPLAELGVPFSPLPEQLHSEDKSQKTYRGDKFARMLADGNADSVSVAFLEPAVRGLGVGVAFVETLCRKVQPHLMTQQYVCNCANHYARTYSELQKRRSVREQDPDAPLIAGLGKRSRLDDKYLAHGLRMGLHALHTERTGQRQEAFAEETQARLRALKTHQMPFPETLAWFEDVSAALLYEGSTPNADGAPVFLYNAARAAHLGRGETLRAVITQHFRATFGCRAGGPTRTRSGDDHINDSRADRLK